MLNKTSETNQDPHLALLDYRNTPIDGVSPAQALMSGRLRAALPVTHDHLNPAIINAKDFQPTRIRSQETKRKYYDRTAKSLPALTEGEAVPFKIHPQAKLRKPAVVMRKHETLRSYILCAEDGTE